MTCKSNSFGRNLPPIPFELVPLTPLPEVTELMGDAGLDAWFEANDFQDTQAEEA
jgi:hypothetical protein